MARLLVDGADLRRPLLMTFSRRASELTKSVERITAQAMGPAIAAVTFKWEGTSRGIGAQILREQAFSIGLNPEFSIHDREDNDDLLNLCRHAEGFSKTEH